MAIGFNHSRGKRGSEGPAERERNVRAESDKILLYGNSKPLSCRDGTYTPLTIDGMKVAAILTIQGC
jgi:hypothetical protein